jgi:hypothetical protein
MIGIRPEERLAVLEEPAADEVGGEETQDGDEDQRHHHPEPRHRERQALVEPVGARNERHDDAVDPLDERAGDVDGQEQRRRDD